jgi:transposase
MTEALDEYGTTLLDVDRVGPVLGVRLIERTGRASRFPNTDAFAGSAGVAPIGVVSGEHTRHRLSRSGDRRLNSALHLVAVTQVRMTNSAGRRYFDNKIGEGKTGNEAMRCLKRRIASQAKRSMLADEKRRRHTAQPSARAA